MRTLPPGASIHELKRLHKDLDARLTRLRRHARLCPSEQLEVKVIKKAKLSTKDRIVALQTKQ